MGSRTVPQELQQRQVDGPLPAGALVQGDAVARGSKDLAGADGDELAALILAGHVIEHGCVIDEGIQLPEGRGHEGQSQSPPDALLAQPGTPLTSALLLHQMLTRGELFSKSLYLLCLNFNL